MDLAGTRRLAWVIALSMMALLVLVLALALWARHVWVEPAAMALACDAERWRSGCVLRTLVIEAFVQQRLAWLALLCALLAAWRRSATLAVAALAAGLAALVLYSADLAAPALLIALLAWVSASRASRGEAP